MSNSQARASRLPSQTTSDYYELLCSIGMRSAADEARLRIDVIAVCDSGESQAFIVKKFGLDSRRVDQILSAAGRKTIPVNRTNYADRNRLIVEARKRGANCAQIAAQFGMTLSAVYNVLSAKGCVSRAKREDLKLLDREFDEHGAL